MTRARFWRSPGGIAFGGFLVVAGVLLVLEHRAHVLGALAWLLILLIVLLCIGMVFLMLEGGGKNSSPRR